MRREPSPPYGVRLTAAPGAQIRDAQAMQLADGTWKMLATVGQWVCGRTS